MRFNNGKMQAMWTLHNEGRFLSAVSAAFALVISTGPRVSAGLLFLITYRVT